MKTLSPTAAMVRFSICDFLIKIKFAMYKGVLPPAFDHIVTTCKVHAEMHGMLEYIYTYIITTIRSIYASTRGRFAVVFV